MLSKKLLYISLKYGLFYTAELIVDTIGPCFIASFNHTARDSLAPIVTLEMAFYFFNNMLEILDLQLSSGNDNDATGKAEIISAGLTASIIYALPVTMIFYFGGTISEFAGYSSNVSHDAGAYTRYFSIGILPAFCWQALANSCMSLEASSLPTYLWSIPGVILGNAIGISLTHGYFDLPQLGTRGYGIGYAVQYWLDFLLLAIAVKQHWFIHKTPAPSRQPPSLKSLFKTIWQGFTQGLYALSDELALFSLNLLAIVYQSKNERTAFAIAVLIYKVQVGALQGIYDANSNELGESKELKREHIIANTRQSLGLGAAWTAISGIILSVLANPIASLFNALNPTQDITQPTASLIRWLCVAQLAHSIVNANSSTLRSLNHSLSTSLWALTGITSLSCGTAWLLLSQSVSLINPLGISFVAGMVITAAISSVKLFKNLPEKNAPLLG